MVCLSRLFTEQTENHGGSKLLVWSANISLLWDEMKKFICSGQRDFKLEKDVTEHVFHELQRNM